MLDVALLLVAAFFAGTLNAVAGGGSFLTLPALIVVGVPPVVANATGTVALLPGYVASIFGSREDMEPAPGLTMRWVVALSLAGGVLGAGLLLLTSDAAFKRLIPWLLLLATAMFAFGPRLRRWAGASGQGGSASRPKAVAGLLLVAGYGGYFNGGMGILLLALFGLLGQTRLNAMNAVKNLVSTLLTAIAVAIYAAGGIVQWKEALLMMAAATLGGYLGARGARRLPAPVLRWGIVAIGLAMTVLFFARQ
ncbi:MAG: sulfite exporter TauE/SafE family protein [Rubrivivax sp.]|nr:sulfite exporter TauE/SafE family protein [Rubrivivax sp.]